MNFLSARYAVVCFLMREGGGEEPAPLQDLEPYLGLTPYIVYDMDGALLTSMRIGELINAANAVRERWGETFPGFGLINVSDTNRKVIGQTGLDAYLRIYPDLPAAVQGLTTAKAA